MDQGSAEHLHPGDHGVSQAELDVLIGPALLCLQNTVVMAMLRVRQRMLQGAVMFCSVFLLLWTASFLYASFYYSYMPKAVYSTPVHYHYRTDCESSAFLCSYPMANISLLRNGKNQAMTSGQAYQISLELEMPDSPANQELGMFMVRMTCYSREGRKVASSARSARQLLSTGSSRFTMLRYRSGMLTTMKTLLFLPAFLTGAAEQKQLLDVLIFSDYTDNPYAPSTTAIIEILSNKVQIYSAHLYIHAHFTGIRYLLFTFPLTSALVGVSSNFIFLSMLLVFSYMRLLLGVAGIPQQHRTDRGTSEERRDMDNSQQENDKDGSAETKYLSDSSVLLDPLQNPTNLSHWSETDASEQD